LNNFKNVFNVFSNFFYKSRFYKRRFFLFLGSTLFLLLCLKRTCRRNHLADTHAETRT